MAAKRRGISKRIRFEVFKRDGFACQYCGAKAPDVLLHVDHVAPVSKGGENELLNYLTACEACNLGKGARELDDNSILAKQRAQLAELSERREQLRLMVSWRDGLRDLEREKLDTVVARMDAIHPGWKTNDHGRAGFVELLKKVPYEIVIQAIDEVAKTLVFGADGKVTEESIHGISDRLRKVAFVKKAERDQPGISELYYIRGIARKRCNTFTDHWALSLLKQARAAGVPTELLKEVALETTSWWKFVGSLEDLIARYSA